MIARARLVRSGCVVGKKVGMERMRTFCGLSHLDTRHKASMVDVSNKAATKRSATAKAEVHLGKKIHDMLSNTLTATTKKGDVLTIAQIAGIQAAKQTSNLIPLCHPLPLSHISVDVELTDGHTIVITAKVSTEAKTGVEMEALTAVSVAALTVYDMCKSGGKGMTIHKISLQEKSGGQHGDYGGS